MNRVMLVAFQGETMCFVHVLLNALDMRAKGFDVKVIIEGMATQFVASLADQENPFTALYEKVKAAGLFEGVCKACSAKTGALAAAQEQGLSLLDDMSGHPSLGRYIEEGYAVMIF
ncbi:MAG: cytoplasmic protein [Bacillota bacterium]